MEATVVSVGKSVLSGALGYAKSALAEEVALQLAVQRDHAFIRGELEMMLAFLMAAHDERDEHVVVKTWVKQVRDVAYDVEDSLEYFAVRLGKPSWWRIFRTLLYGRRVAMQMKELRAKVEDVSQRNVRYRLIKGSGSKPATGTGQSSSSMTGETMSGMEEARREKDKAKVDLIRLINRMDENLQVIAIWGTSDVLQEASIIKLAYNDLKRSNKFECHVLIQMTHPFNPTEFLKNIIRQFYVNYLEDTVMTTQQDSTSGVQDLRRMGMMIEGDLVDAFKEYLNDKKYLIVLTDLSNVGVWDKIKAFFPSNKKGSRLIVCAEQVEVASLCVGPETVLLDHKQLASDHALYAFYEKGSQGGTDSMDEDSSSNTMDTINSSKNSTVEKRLTRMETILTAFKESQLIGREKEKEQVINMISNRRSQQFEVISIYGMGGLGKTTLVKQVYQSQELNAMFEKRACVTIKRPFNLGELLNSLAIQLGDTEGEGHKLAGLLEGKSYLIVLDDMSSTIEWNAVVEYFPTSVTTSRIIVTTREENICKHCSKKEINIHNLELLQSEDAKKLFLEKVFGTVKKSEQYLEFADETELILKKCKGLPLAIVTMGGFLAKQPKTLMEWRKFSEHISSELEINTDLQRIPNALIKSYEGLPYHLKSCFLYLSIFPEDYNISRKRLVRRWIVEGYTSEVRGKSLEEIADSHFMELIDRSVILPVRKEIPSGKGIDSCQLHDLMREISISRAMDENLVFRLEEGSSSLNNTQAKIRHVAISSNWEGDKCEFESAVDLSHIRSLTLFGKWRPFFISEKMRLLRVLDLEGTWGLLDHHLEHIGRLLHLKYVSLRRCHDIYHLPDSWGNLRQLQTLDMKGTCICKLPKAIIELTKLQYLFAGDLGPVCVNSDKRVPNNLAKLCGACCAPKLLKDVEQLVGDPNWHDVCTFWCSVVFPTLASRRLLNPFGVVVPRGVRKLKALRTLGVVNIAGSGKAILRDIRKLTQLRKLAVTGINKKNCQELCSVLAELSHLESLSLESLPDESGLHGCLDGVPLPPKNLQSLKLDVTLVKLPEWIRRGLQSLVKLVLGWTELTEVDATMQVLGKLPNLGILHLMRCSFNEGEELRLTFHREAFPSLMVLHLFRIRNLVSVGFEEAGATPKLELLLLVDYAARTRTRSISGLSDLPSLKEVVIKGHGWSEKLMASVRNQLSRNPNNPVLK